MTKVLEHLERVKNIKNQETDQLPKAKTCLRN